MSNVTSAVLTESQVSEILLRTTVLGQTQTAVAEVFGVGRSTVGDIVNGRTWRAIPAPRKVKNGFYQLSDNRVYSLASDKFLSVSLDKSRNQRYVTATIKGKKEKIYL